MQENGGNAVQPQETPQRNSVLLATLCGLCLGILLYPIMSYPSLLWLLIAAPFLGIMGWYLYGIPQLKLQAKAIEGGTAVGLGLLFACGLLLWPTKYYQLAIYAMSLSVYHSSEYIFVCVYHFESLSFDSYLINQSKHYGVAMACSFAEYFLECWLLGEYKNVVPLVVLGLLSMVVGQCLRIAALFTAQRSFHHVIQECRQADHVLVTTGVYAFSRHPGYCGWYLWAVSSQVMLVSPLSVALFAFASHVFFKERIEYEEYTLIQLFGLTYLNYMQNVPTRIPFIPGLDPTPYFRAYSFRIHSSTPDTH